MASWRTTRPFSPRRSRKKKSNKKLPAVAISKSGESSAEWKLSPKFFASDQATSKPKRPQSPVHTMTIQSTK